MTVPGCLEPRNAQQAGLVTDFSRIATGLHRRDGQLFAAREIDAVSYPDDGHDGCRVVEDGSFWFTHRNAVLLEALRSHPPGGELLDVGGGNGHVTRALLDAGYAAALLEPGADGIAHARARGVSPLIHATLDQARFHSGTIAAVGAFDVVEHVRDDAAFLAELRRILIPGGRLYVTVPAYDWLWSHADVSAGHYRRYSPRGLQQRLAAAGFEVERITCFFSFLALPLFALRSLPDRLRAPAQDRQGQSEREHAPPPVARHVIDAMARAERRWLSAGRQIPVGSSVLAIARHNATR